MRFPSWPTQRQPYHWGTQDPLRSPQSHRRRSHMIENPPRRRRVVPPPPPPPRRPNASSVQPPTATPLVPLPTERSIQPSAPLTPTPARPPVQRFAAHRAQRLVIPTMFMRLEPAVPLSAINDDPLFAVHSAARIVGLGHESLEKRRQRGQPPDYIQYHCCPAKV
jgi:hypothetical protein